jgi:mannan endo-1,4-beta-mannosidase
MRRSTSIPLVATSVALACAAPASAARSFGVYTDPSQLLAWSQQVGAAPTLVARFEAFSQKRTLDDWLAQVQVQHVSKVLVTWEPWQPVPVSASPADQSRPQPGYRNRDVVHGVQDSYIRSFARSLSRFPGVVYLRYAHEMNGTWYPWSADARQYPRAWRHMVRIFRSAGAANVRFVWSPNLNLYEARKPWLRKLRPYWPGAGYVDDVGATTINFGGTRARFYTTTRVASRLDVLRKLYKKPLMLTETNTAFEQRLPWLTGMRKLLRRTPWIRALVWSQLKSRGQANTPGVGRLDWDVRKDPSSAAVLRGIADDLQR